MYNKIEPPLQFGASKIYGDQCRGKCGVEHRASSPSNIAVLKLGYGSNNGDALRWVKIAGYTP